MSIDGATPVDFDYVLFIRYLCQNPDSPISMTTDGSYNDDQKNKLNEMLIAIQSKAKESQTSDSADQQTDNQQLDQNSTGFDF